MMEYPKIRLLTPIPVELPEGNFIFLQDPNRYTPESVFLPPGVFSVVQFFDGHRSISDIQRDYHAYYGTRLATEAIRSVVEQLDQYFLMESPAFHKHRQHLRHEFAALSIRHSSHQGAAYPDDAAAIIDQFDRFFTHENGPGNVPAPSSSGEMPCLQAIMAPHIDIKAGGVSFAWAYDALAASEADLFIILGTSHVDMQNFFALTRKGFETPFGVMETESCAVNTLANHLPYDPFEDELIHKYEHSIEFQVVFLQYWQQKLGNTNTAIKILPILCGGSLHETIYDDRSVHDVPHIDESIAALQQVLRQHGNACLIASVDFSHVGTRYGDSRAPNAETLALVERTDRALLSTLERGDYQDFLAQLTHTRNATQVCGYAPIYTMLRLLEGAKGTLLHYDRTELSQGSFVSFASMVWKTVSA